MNSCAIPGGSRKRPPLIGLTGGIASGKSAVSRRLKSLGADVIDTDLIARDIVEPGCPAYDDIVTHFGRTVLAHDGTLDRAALRRRVFGDTDERRVLESFTHPRIRAETWRRVSESSGPYIVLVVPLLVESDFHTQVDRVLVVDVDPDVQLERLIGRDDVDEDTARAMIAAQADRAERLAKADDVIVNDGTFEELLLQVDALHDDYLRLAELSRNGDAAGM